MKPRATHRGAVAIALAALVGPSPVARAADPLPAEFVLEVEVEPSCPTLSGETLAAQIREALEQERTPVASASPQHRLRVRCEAEMVHLELAPAPVSATRGEPASTSVERWLPAPEDADPHRERIVALAALPLFELLAEASIPAVSSPAEVPAEAPELLPPTEPAPARAPDPDPVAADAAPEKAAPPPSPTPAVPSRNRFEIDAGAGFGSALAPRPWALANLAYARYPHPHWGFGVGLGFAFGRRPIEVGATDMLEFPARFEGRWTRPLARRARVEIALGVELALSRLRGRSSDPALGERAFNASSGGPRLGLRFAFAPSSRFEIGGELAGGWRIWAPTGIALGEEVASFRGPALNLALRLGWGWGAPREDRR